MENINVKETMEKNTPVIAKERFLRYAKYSADDAYARLKIVRQTKDDLGIKLNKHVRYMPEDVRTAYEDLYLSLKKLETLEAQYVACGE